jgi:Coenzyme PQQ synthesis protein D (PqqD)
MTIDADTLLAARLRMPQHVVHRSFAAETVVLNLKTGKYHGLNPVAGRMLDLINDSPTVRAAAGVAAQEYGQDLAVIEDDIVLLCTNLLDRDLLEIDAGGQPEP